MITGKASVYPIPLRHERMQRAFSIIELLLLVCIVVIISTIVIPIYSSLQSNTDQAVATQIQSELNYTYAKWKDSGGQIMAAATTSDILYVICSPPKTDGSLRQSPNGAVVDGGTSNQVSVSLPAGTDLSSYALPQASPSSVVTTAGTPGFLISSPGVTPSASVSPQFTVIPAGAVQWSSPAQLVFPIGDYSSHLTGNAVKYNGVYLGTLYGCWDVCHDPAGYTLDPETQMNATFTAYDYSKNQYYTATLTFSDPNALGEDPRPAAPSGDLSGKPGYGISPSWSWNELVSVGTIIH